MPARILLLVLLTAASLAGCARRDDGPSRPVSGAYLGAGGGGG